MRHRHYFYHQLAKAVLIFFFLYFIYLYFLFSTNKEVHKIRHKANQLPLYQCPPTRTLSAQQYDSTTPTKLAPVEVDSRILVITQLNSSHSRKRITSFLGYLKVAVRAETLNEDFLFFELASQGRFFLIIFEDYHLYHQLSNVSKSLVHEYCNKHNVGLISFLSLKSEEEEKDFGLFTAKGGQLAHNLAFAESSPIRNVGKVSSKLAYAHPYLPQWTLMNSHSKEVSIVLEAEDVYGTPLAAAVLILNTWTSHVVFGYSLQHWMIEIAFLDALMYMAPNFVDNDLERFLQIDIDDVFVGQTGTRFIEEDVFSLRETQEDLRKYIHNFSFALGFSGYFFRHGDSLEIQGDEQLQNQMNFSGFLTCGATTMLMNTPTNI